MRDSGVPTAGTASTLAYAYTSVAEPGVPTFTNLANTTADVNAFDSNGNPTANPTTTFYFRCTGATPADDDWVGKYAAADGTASAAIVWLSDAQIEALTLEGLNQATTYLFRARGKNGDDVTGELGDAGSFLTTGDAPESPPQLRLWGISSTGKKLH